MKYDEADDKMGFETENTKKKILNSELKEELKYWKTHAKMLEDRIIEDAAKKGIKLESNIDNDLLLPPTPILDAVRKPEPEPISQSPPVDNIEIVTPPRDKTPDDFKYQCSTCGAFFDDFADGNKCPNEKCSVTLKKGA